MLMQTTKLSRNTPDGKTNRIIYIYFPAPRARAPFLPIYLAAPELAWASFFAKPAGVEACADDRR